MGPLLRKRLSKRASEATEVNSGSTTDTAPPLLAVLNHLQPLSPTSKEDLDSTPPPSDHLVLPQTPDKVRNSATISLLERYKERAPIAKAPAMPTPSEVLTMARSKIPAFSGDFDDNKDLPLTPTHSQPEIPTAIAPVKSTIRTVGGVDFQMFNAAQASADLSRPRSNNAEPARADPGENEHDSPQGQRRRLTRSQSKKEERSDSTVGSIGNETLKDHSDAAVTPKDNGDGKREIENKDAQDAESETPPARRVVNKKPSDTTSPTKTKPKTSRFTRLSSANRKKEDKTPSPTPRTPTSHTANKSTEDDSSSSSSVNFILEATTAQIGPAQHHHETNPDSIEPLPTVRVSPPVVAFHDQILPGLLWTSPLSATSRPALPWTWCKRWTCCCCAAITIVEQSVCSKLACGHRRCGSRCVVSEGRRVTSL